MPGVGFRASQSEKMCAVQVGLGNHTDAIFDVYKDNSFMYIWRQPQQYGCIPQGDGCAAEWSHLGGQLALDGVAVAHGQRRLIVGQLLEAGEAVVPVGWVVGSPCVSPMACATMFSGS